MASFSIFIILSNSYISIAWAQYAAPTPKAPAAPTTSTETVSGCRTGNIHKVSVGSGGFKFDPSIVFAHPGDVVVFTFFPTNHSVVRAEYTGTQGGNPCVPIELLHPGASGFLSGNKEVDILPNNTTVSTKTMSKRFVNGYTHSA
jgi:plastocyanin